MTFGSLSDRATCARLTSRPKQKRAGESRSTTQRPLRSPLSNPEMKASVDYIPPGHHLYDVDRVFVSGHKSESALNLDRAGALKIHPSTRTDNLT